MAKGDIKEVKLKDNEILLPTGEVKIIKSTKLKYMKDGSFNGYQLIRKFGVAKLFANFTDGESVLLSFLCSVFDQKVEEITWVDEADIPLINEIVTKTLKVNEIDEDKDFLANLVNEEVIKE
jgi:hypothetical protein